MGNICTINNAVTNHYLTQIRNVDVHSDVFRKYLSKLAEILFYEAAKSFEVKFNEVKTWTGEYQFQSIDEADLVFIPVLRGGLPMIGGLTECFPKVMVGFLAMIRDSKSLKSEIAYKRLPNLTDKTVIILDAMVGTGGTLNQAIECVQLENPKKIIVLSILAASCEINALSLAHQNVTFVMVKSDEPLNEEGFIIPGIGDIGERAFLNVEFMKNKVERM